MDNAELSQLVTFMEWGELAAAVEEELAASNSGGNLQGPPWRRLLANHVSLCCQPRHIGGVVASLEGCFTCTASASGGGVCELVLPNLFVNVTPPSPWVVRVEAATLAAAEEECCRLTLIFCISVGPDLVRLHPSTLRDIGRIREMGRKVRMLALALAFSVVGGMPWSQATSLLQHAAQMQRGPAASTSASGAAASASASGAAAFGAAGAAASASASGAAAIPPKPKRPVPKFVPPAAPQEQEERHLEVVRFLHENLSENTRHDPSRLTGKVMRYLAASLPPKTLKDFMLRRPEYFIVWPGEGKRWTFTLTGGTSVSGAAASTSASASGAAVAAPPGLEAASASGAAASTSASGAVLPDGSSVRDTCLLADGSTLWVTGAAASRSTMRLNDSDHDSDEDRIPPSFLDGKKFRK